MIKIILLAILLTAVFTWPFILNIGSFYTDQGDYATHGSILWWNQDSIKTGRIFNQKEYFRGYMFYPHPYSLTFANNHVFPALIFSPIFWLTNSLPFSINLYVFFTFVACFCSSFYVINYFVKNKLASLAGAFIFTFNPQIITRFPQHIELLARFFLPLIILFAYQTFKKPNFKSAFFLWLALTLNSLSANYFQIFAIIFLPVFAIPFLFSNLRKKNWQYFLDLIKVSLVGLIFVPVILYFNLPFWNFSIKEGVVRSIDESIFFSARINDWFAPTENSLLYGNWSKYLFNFREPKDDRGILNYEEHTLFLGVLPIILFVLGLKPFLKQSFKSPFLILLAVSFILTFGPYLSYQTDGFKLPFYYLYQVLPLMKGFRAPGRFEYIFYIPFSLIATFGALWLIKKRGIWIIGVIGVILILENFTIQDYSTRSGIFHKIDQIGLENISFLRSKKVLHLPVYTLDDADIFGKNSVYANWLTKTHEIMVNGNSGYFPPDILALLYETDKDLNEQVLIKLSALKVDYIVIHKDLMTSGQLQKLQSQENLYIKGIVFNQFDTVIIDLAKLNLAPKICNLEQDFDIQIEGEKPFRSVILTNKEDCYLPSIYEDRYREIKGVNVRLPIIIGPGEQIILSNGS